jgi:hypothetical protein
LLVQLQEAWLCLPLVQLLVELLAPYWAVSVQFLALLRGLALRPLQG